MHPVNISPVYDILNNSLSVLVQGVIVVVCGWVTYAVHRYASFIGKQNEALLAKTLDTVLQNGVIAGINKLDAWETMHQDVSVKGQIAAWAAQYAVDHASDTIKKFGISPDDLVNMALARIPPPPPSGLGTTGVALPSPAPVKVETLPPVS